MTTTITGDQTGTVGLINTKTAVASTSGTSIDFTGIPAGVKRITVMFNGVSTNGTSDTLIQLGSGSVETSGYSSYATRLGATGGVYYSSSLGFTFSPSASAATNRYGTVVFTLVGSNTWIANGLTTNPLSPNETSTVAGGKTTAGTLDRVRITTVNGTDTFDAGSINILYE